MPQSGVVVRGNIDLSTRPRVKNPDGSISTVRSIGISEDGKEIVIPTVSDDGRILSDREAVDLYHRSGKHLGIFADRPSADAFAQSLHESEARKLMPQSSADLAKKYGGVQTADLAKQFGGAAVPTESAPATTPAQAPADSGGGGMFATIGDLMAGVGKSALGVVKGGGDLLRMIPGVDAASKAIGEVELPVSPEPTNTAQAVGKFAADTGQFFLPTGVIGKGAKLAEVAKAAGLTALQTGSPTAAGLSGALTAVIPGAKTVQRVAGALDESATKSVMRALGPTKENMKATARSIAPEMIERGVKGSRDEMLAQAKTMTAKVGAEKGAEVARMGEAGVTIPAQAIRVALHDAARPLTTINAAGVPVVIPGGQPVIKALEKLDDFVVSLGTDIPADKADKIKQAWQRIVAKSGLYGGKVGASATDSAKAWTFREGSSAMKRALDDAGSDTYTALNKEYQFWRGLKDVLTETQRRTSGQAGTGLVASGVGSIGAGYGLYSGDSLTEKLSNAAIYGVGGRQLIKLLQSPQFATKVSAPLKKRLADALASDTTTGLYSAMRSILSSLPSNVTSQLQEPVK